MTNIIPLRRYMPKIEPVKRFGGNVFKVSLIDVVTKKTVLSLECLTETGARRLAARWIKERMLNQ